MTENSLSVRAMTPDDIPAGLRLCRASGWNQLEEDWRSFVRPPHSGGWVAERNGIVVGTVAYLRFGTAFTWISMMLVAPEERRTGIGSRLMATALDELRADGCLRLDATPAGEPLYRRFGFESEYSLLRMRWSGGPLPRSSAHARPIASVDLAGIFARDLDAFRGDRAELLESFFRRAPDLAYIFDGAYCLGRPGYLCSQLGPLVADHEAGARELVIHCLATHPDGRFVMDVPQSAARWVAWLESIGFLRERPFLRMHRGGSPPKFPDCQFAIAGPEFG